MALTWEELQSQAKKLECQIDMKLLTLSKLDAAKIKKFSESDSEPLLADTTFESLYEDISTLLEKLTKVNEKMNKVANEANISEGTQSHILNRHKDILQEYKREFQKCARNIQARKERDNLLTSVRHDINAYKSGGTENYQSYLGMEENEHLNRSERLVMEQIDVAMEMKENLTSQRQHIKGIQIRMQNVLHRFPVFNNLIRRIRLRKRKETIILTSVVGFCVVLMLLYVYYL